MSVHRLQQGDVTLGAIGRLMGDVRADLVYSDPPWGPGNLQYWRTHNGESVRPDWILFRERYIEAVTTHCAGPAFIEMGLRFLLATHLDRERVGVFAARFARQLDNEYVARQQCRQLLLNDYENNLAIDNKPDPREELIRYYDEVL